MKIVIATLVVFLFVFSILLLGDEKPEQKKFEVTFTVKYNAITLQEASDLEAKFRELYKDACVVDVVVKEAGFISYGYLQLGSAINSTAITDTAGWITINPVIK